MFDAKIPGGFALEARETDHTTGRSGFMIASAANGFMDTTGQLQWPAVQLPAEYSTARAQNVIRGASGRT